MILVAFIAILMTGGIIAWIAASWSHSASRWISLVTLLVDFSLAISVWMNSSGLEWIEKFSVPWVPDFGISFSLALDGLSLLMLVLTFFLGIFGVLVSWNEIQERVGFFHFNLLWVLAGISGVFLTMDLFLFYFFWEVMLIPMYFLIGIWGHENKRYAAFKFFIFTQASGLLMLLAILGLYFVHKSNSGTGTFDYFQLLGTQIPLGTSRWLMLGFLAAFIVKLPVVPFHTWLPDAHSQAPTAGSLILAGLLLKTGAYGLIRFVVPLFPEASAELAPWAMLLGVVGILYGASLAFAQTDLKRLVAYTSVSHMGFVILGVFAFNQLAMQGVVMQMITHAISTGALFAIAGVLYERIHTRDILAMGGFWGKAPFMGVVTLIFVMASLGLPGLGNFVAEFLTLIGSWQANPMLTIFAAIGIVTATAYSLRIMQKVFLGKWQSEKAMPDLSLREKLIFIPLIVTIIWLGLFPQTVINTVKPMIDKQFKIEQPTSIQNNNGVQ
ncbi:MAG: NADH-quinone oxidoreductase subunit M [Bacteroidetes bacterium]|nr:NADH-quinone oxidoreductase subunit M [Bacteroidota bacterium]MBS1540404.1 NADH-quinone oxidoreductase subunit M [Bacteroidota bacterium]